MISHCSRVGGRICARPKETIIDVNIIIREIESKDYLSVAAIWRDVLGIMSATDG